MVPWCCREHDKKVCCLGLTSLLTLPADQMPGEALERIFKAILDLLVSYKDQIAGSYMASIFFQLAVFFLPLTGLFNLIIVVYFMF